MIARQPANFLEQLVTNDMFYQLFKMLETVG